MPKGLHQLVLKTKSIFSKSCRFPVNDSINFYKISLKIEATASGSGSDLQTKSEKVKRTNIFQVDNLKN